jgi:type VI secretion system protein ImpL
MNPLALFYTLRSYVEGYAGFLRETRFWSLIWVAAILVCIWFYGDALSLGNWRPLAEQNNRIFAMAGVVVAWLIYVVVGIFRSRRAEKAMIDALTDDATATDATVKEEIELLRKRLQEALSKLKTVTRKRWNYIYDFPWYLIIGAPGSGKTTALLNSGLQFPLGEDLGAEHLQGVGGTRACDWWFAEDAILMDTAGRYTTQDSDAAVDGAAWGNFLALLKRHRPLKPVNGVLVTVSVEGLLKQSVQARLKEIRTIKQRLRDLEDNLKVRLPVYLVFTKIDVLAGYGEFFDSFNKFDREQVFGATFTLAVSQAKGKIAAAFDNEVDLLLERINRLLIERMQQEPDELRRAQIFRFPAQFASLKSGLVEIVAELTAPSKLVGAPLLRGVYFVSATQTGLVLDKVGQAISERFNLSSEAVSSGQASEKPSFLSRLLREVIFNEANLVTIDERLQRRSRWIRIGLSISLVAGVAMLIGGWTHAYLTNENVTSALNETFALYDREAGSVPFVNVDTDDFLRVAPPLNLLRDAVHKNVDGTARWYHFGLDQEDKLIDRVNAAYRRALNGFLLPRLIVHLQMRMQRADISGAELYDALKLYLMLGGLGPFDKDFANAAISAEFDKIYAGAGRAQIRVDLLGHAQALFAGHIATLSIDEDQIRAARAKLALQSPQDRVFEMVGATQAARSLPEWRPIEKAGSGGEVIFERASRRSLRDGIPGLYTRDGYSNVFLPRLDAVLEQLTKEAWVREAPVESEMDGDRLKRDVLRRYFGEFHSRWNDLLTDLSLRDPPDIIQASQIVGVLASKDNPARSFVTAVARATDLRSEQPSDATNADKQRAVTSEEALRLEKLHALTDGIEDKLFDPYSGLRRIVTSPAGQTSSLDAINEVFIELYRQLSHAATTTGAVNKIFGVEGGLFAANQRLISEARLLAEPVDRWYAKLGADIARLTASGARQSISELWQTTGGRFCRLAIEGRYPFNPDAANDVAINDFVRMFGPSGEFSTFFDLHVKAFVDVSRSPWRWSGMNGNAAIPSADLAQFELAKMIQTAFFSDGGNNMNLTLDITPSDLSSDATSVLLSINDQEISYDHGPIQSKSLQWPGTGNRIARLAFQPPGPNLSVTKSGPWAVFRLFDLAQKKKLSDDRFLATFKLNTRTAAFDLRVGSVLNPFTLTAMRGFKCPDSL